MWALLMLTGVAAAPTLTAQQQNRPRIGYAYPAGGQRGTTVRVEVGGQFLNGASTVLVLGGGVEARVIGIDLPLAGAALTARRDSLQAMQKRPRTPELVRQMMALRDTVASSVRRRAIPALADLVTLEIAIAPDADVGERQLRIQTQFGLAGPLAFRVGELPEFREKDVKNTPADMETTVTLPATVNGRLIPGEVDRVRAPARTAPQYMPGDADRYRFTAHKGESLVFAVAARALVPYLADAVPGWIQPVVTLYDAQGHELAFNDDYRFDPDPVLHYDVSADGEYVLEIRDAIYRGREDFVYRVTMGTVPFVTSIYPLGGRAGGSHTVELSGWNLASSRMTFDASRKEAGVYQLAVAGAMMRSNPIAFAVDALPEIPEQESNGTRDEAQAVTLPVIINGRIDRSGDVDRFRFNGRAGDTVAVEVIARRLGSPLDAAIELLDDAGRRIAFNDDHEDVLAGRETHHADSYALAALPATGSYLVRVTDVQRKGGRDHAYRLRLSAPRPGFDLRVSPSILNATGGATIPITVTAVRHDGFTGDIALAIRDAPTAWLSGAVVPAGQDQVRMTLTVPPTSAAAVIALRVEGSASIRGKTVTQLATPADDMTQAFAWHHLVATDALLLSVTARGGSRMPARIVSGEPVRMGPGGTTRLRVALPPGYATFENLQFELSDAPDGFALRDQVFATGGAEFTLAADAAKVKPGARGNLIVTVSGERVAPANAPNAGTRRRIMLGTVPAISYEIRAR